LRFQKAKCTYLAKKMSCPVYGKGSGCAACPYGKKGSKTTCHILKKMAECPFGSKLKDCPYFPKMKGCPSLVKGCPFFAKVKAYVHIGT
jgi:hypothetical protein